ncbi:MAG: BatA domain-containing protein, partial [Lentisphaeria bacterium]|nr:BatA domain-containing protein [Lentisphaeria bacterium]
MPFFLGSSFLLAGLAVVVPIALHLLHRRRPQPIMFGTLRFLQTAIA